MDIVNGKALRVPTDTPNRIANVISKSLVLDDGDVLVHWGIEETRMLVELGYSPPSPILKDYDWPGKYTPFDHQRKTAEFLTMCKRGFCFSEQGTGKTASAIWAADYLLSIGAINRVLVICPMSIMDSAWRDDLFTFAMHRTVDVAYGAAAKRKKIIQSDAEFIIINYDGLAVVRDELDAGGFDLIIVDEATHYKNAQTKRWKTLNSIVTDDTWIWQMTGTPAAQSPVDAYGLAKLSDPATVPRFYGAFRDQVMYKVSRFTWKIRANAGDVVHEVLQPAIRFTKKECLDLPDMVYVNRDVSLTPQQHKYYEELRKQMVIEASGENVTASTAAINVNKLLQISSGAVYTDDKEVLEFDISTRYKVLLEVLGETSNKVLVFAPFKHIMRILEEKLTADGFTVGIINGEVKAHERTELIRSFQNEDDPRIFLIQPQAAAHGVTLTAADTVVWWAPTASLETYAQANARVHRPGQVNKCTVVRLRGSKAEHRMYSLLDNKIDVHTSIIERYKELLD